MFRYHQSCRACGLGKPEIPTLKVSTSAGDAYGKATGLVEVLDLGLQPLANSFVELTADQSGYAPLKLMACPRCGLGQLNVVVDPRILYSDYRYVTSHSRTMLQHFEVLRDDILKETTAANSVLEIGSNDGTLLSFLKNNPFSTVLGCDPAENLAAIANKNGIPTFCGMFTEKDCDCHKQKDVVIARHVMCHIDDWQDFVRGLERVTHDESLVVIEVPYYLNMVKSGSWDQIYHEHLSYMNVKAMAGLLSHSKLHIHKVKHYDIHGGAIVMFLRRNASVVKPDPEVATWINNESDILKEWRELSEKKDLMIDDLKSLVSDLITQGKTIVGYGASAKSTVWINACGFTKREIKFLCDETPMKQWKVSPGTNIPIVDPGALTRELPDYALMFCWNFQKEVIDKESIFVEKGGKWIVPVPKVTIV